MRELSGRGVRLARVSAMARQGVARSATGTPVSGACNLKSSQGKLERRGARKLRAFTRGVRPRETIQEEREKGETEERTL